MSWIIEQSTSSSRQNVLTISVLWFILREIELEEKKRLWVHPLNLKRTEHYTIK
jgi:hypothetical protein